MVDTDDNRRTTDNGRRTMPWVWHKLPTGELKMSDVWVKSGLHIALKKYKFFSALYVTHH